MFIPGFSLGCQVFFLPGLLQVRPSRPQIECFYTGGLFPVSGQAPVPLFSRLAHLPRSIDSAEKRLIKDILMEP